MRQAVEPPLHKDIDAGRHVIEKIVDVLLRHGSDEEEILESTAEIVASAQDYPAVFLTTVEEQQNLFLRAFSLRTTRELASKLEPRLQQARRSERPLIQFVATGVQQSLPVRAMADVGGPCQTTSQGLDSNSLFDLLFPLLDKDEAARWQKAAGIERVLALPFALSDEICGCLLVASSRPTFGEHERRLLQAAARHLALGMRNARLYARLEEQSHIAQTFAQMAFSGSVYLHTLRNQIGGLRTYLGLVQAMPQMTPKQREEVITTSRKAMESLDQAAEILDHLHQPWQRHPDEATDVNDCLGAALLKLFRDLTIQPGKEQYVAANGVHIEWRLRDALPAIHTSPELLTEAFRIVLRNALDSLQEKYGADKLEEGHLTLESTDNEAGQVVVTIRDNGTGIAPDDLRRIFDLGWSTKEGKGMGFGLFWTRNFVEGLGGKIEVDSVVQKGATLRFVIPY